MLYKEAAASGKDATWSLLALVANMSGDRDIKWRLDSRRRKFEFNQERRWWWWVWGGVGFSSTNGALASGGIYKVLTQTLVPSSRVTVLFWR